VHLIFKTIQKTLIEFDIEEDTLRVIRQNHTLMHIDMCDIHFTQDTA